MFFISCSLDFTASPTTLHPEKRMDIEVAFLYEIMNVVHYFFMCVCVFLSTCV